MLILVVEDCVNLVGVDLNMVLVLLFICVLGLNKMLV